MLTHQEKHVVFGTELCVPDGFGIMQAQLMTMILEALALSMQAYLMTMILEVIKIQNELLKSF